MQIITAQDRIDQYLTMTGVMAYFSCDPVFSLHRYLPGELLTSPFEKTRYLQFIAEGEVVLYDMPTEDSVAGVDSPFYRASLIGEAELIDPDFSTFFVESRTEVYTLALPLNEYREKLLNDKVFLRFICRSLTKKLNDATSPTHRLPLREQLLRYISAADRSKPIRDLTQLSQLLHVSTRQLTRTLGALCEEGVLERGKKGVYWIADES